MARAYNAQGLAGCVERRKSSKTGLMVSLYNAEQAGMDVEAGPWATVCESHGQVTHHATLADARSWLADPLMWCEVCNGNEADAPR